MQQRLIGAHDDSAAIYGEPTGPWLPRTDLWLDGAHTVLLAAGTYEPGWQVEWSPGTVNGVMHVRPIADNQPSDGL